MDKKLFLIIYEHITLHRVGKKKYSDKQIIFIARCFIVAIVALTYALAMWAKDANVFDLAIWCFSGFGSLFPLVFAAVYWRRATKAGAICCVLVTATVWLTFFIQDFATKSDPGRGEFLVLGMMPVAIIFAASAASLIVVSLLTKPPAVETIEKFVPSRT